MKKLKICTVFISALIVSLTSLSQETTEPKPKGFDKSRLFFGGNIGMSFGSQTFINLSPQVGYQFNQYFSAGTGINYISSSYSIYDYNGDKLYKDSYSYAGLNIFGRVFPISFLFAQVQPEFNYAWGKTKFYYNNLPDIKLEGAFVPVLLVGVGAAIPAGKGRMIAMLQYDVIGDKRSPYGKNAFFTFGYNF